MFLSVNLIDNPWKEREKYDAHGCACVVCVCASELKDREREKRRCQK